MKKLKKLWRLLSSKRSFSPKNRTRKTGKKSSVGFFLKLFLVGVFFLPFLKTVSSKTESVQITDAPTAEVSVSIFDKDGNLLFKDLIGSVSSYKRAPHVVDFVLKELLEEFGQEKLEEGLLVKTGIDLELQNYVQQILLEGSFGFKEDIPQGAVIVVRPKDGEVLAMVGSTNYYARGGEQNNIFTQRGLKISGKSLEMSLWDLARVYSVFANSGKFVDFSILSSTQDEDGKDVGVEMKESLHLIEEMYKIMINNEVSDTGLKIFESDLPSLAEVVVSFSSDYIVGVWSEKDGSGKSIAVDILQRIVAKTGQGFKKGGDI